MKKNTFIVTETIIFIIFLVVIAMNFKSGTTTQFGITFGGEIVLVKTYILALIIFFAGVISGLLYSLSIGARYKEQIEFYSRKNEKLSMQNENDTDEKEALQRKIATLEIALDNALKNK